jgi:hypothetical protein
MPCCIGLPRCFETTVLMAANDGAEFKGSGPVYLLAVAIGPIAALTNLFLSDLLAPSACEQGSKFLLHLCAAMCALLASTGGLIGRRAVTAGQFVAETDPSRWLDVVAFYLSIGSVMAIIAMEIPNLILRSCD